MNKNFSSFWNFIRKTNKVHTKLPDNVDDALGDVDISNLFKNIYKDLYNSVDDPDLELVIDKVKYKARETCMLDRCQQPHIFDENNLKVALTSLKPSKIDYIYDINSNNILYGSDKLKNVILNILNCILTHGNSTEIFNRSLIFPLIKNKRMSDSISNNYRAISLCSVLCKIFEYMILDALKNKLRSDEYQFAYKESHSTTLCTSMVLNTIHYYTEQNSNVFTLFLDATKAFDKVKHSQLFNELLDKGICPIFIRIIINMYMLNNCIVKWNGATSDSFYMKNGVKQGGVLSPIVQYIYRAPVAGSKRCWLWLSNW